MKNPLIILFWLLVLGGILNYFISEPSFTREIYIEMNKANDAYLKGEQAKTIGERKELFNLALKLYTSLENTFHPTHGNGKLYFNIANTYFQLEEYPMASLYYHSALKLMPRKKAIKDRLNVTNEKLELKEIEKESAFAKIVFFYTFLSPPERLQLLFGLSTIALTSGTLFIWKRKKRMLSTAIIAACAACVMLLTIGYSYYLAPIDAIIIRSTSLYRDAGHQYAKVLDEPLLSGKKVEVLDVLEDGKWLKIMTPENNLGYVPEESIRTI